VAVLDEHVEERLVEDEPVANLAAVRLATSSAGER